jgi:hypothetical protein
MMQSAGHAEGAAALGAPVTPTMAGPVGGGGGLSSLLSSRRASKQASGQVAACLHLHAHAALRPPPVVVCTATMRGVEQRRLACLQ